LGREQQRGARPDPDLRQLPQPDREHFGAIDEFVCKNADYLDWDAFAVALADHVRLRNSPAERARRKIEAAKRRQRRATKPTTGSNSPPEPWPSFECNVTRGRTTRT
jgi:hypothetical protein